MGGCVGSIHTGEPAMKVSKQFCRIVNHYLLYLVFGEASTNDDRLAAFSHWEHVLEATIHSNTVGGSSPVARLYDNFYRQLFETAPHLKPLFQSNQQVQRRVLVHISAGMRLLLHSDYHVHKGHAAAVLHTKIGVKPQDFDPLGETLIQAMRITSGGQWGERIELAWRCINCHNATLILVNIPNTNLDLRDCEGQDDH